MQPIEPVEKHNSTRFTDKVMPKACIETLSRTYFKWKKENEIYLSIRMRANTRRTNITKLNGIK